MWYSLGIPAKNFKFSSLSVRVACHSQTLLMASIVIFIELIDWL